MRQQIDSLKASYEQRLMECEENLLTEQMKCREVIKARVDPLELEIKALKQSENVKHQQLKDKSEKILAVEREL